MVDIKFTTNVSNSVKINNAFADIFPIPLDKNGDPTMAKSKWVKLRIKQFVKNVVRQSEERTAKAKITIEENIIQ